MFQRMYKDMKPFMLIDDKNGKDVEKRAGRQTLLLVILHLRALNFLKLRFVLDEKITAFINGIFQIPLLNKKMCEGLCPNVLDFLNLGRCNPGKIHDPKFCKRVQTMMHRLSDLFDGNLTPEDPVLAQLGWPLSK